MQVQVLDETVLSSSIFFNLEELSPFQSRGRVKFWTWIRNVQHTRLRSCVGFKLHDVCNISWLFPGLGYLPSSCRESPLFTWNIVMKSYVLELCPFRHCAPSIQQVRAVEKTTETRFATWWECFGLLSCQTKRRCWRSPSQFVTELNLSSERIPSGLNFTGGFGRDFASWLQVREGC